MKKILIILFTAIMLCGVCVFAALCETSGSGNSLFTDEFFDGAVKLESDLHMLECEGDDMKAVISALKAVKLNETNEDVFADAHAYADLPAMERPIGLPFFKIWITYEDGHTSSVVFTNDKLQMPAKENGLTSDKSFTVPSGDLYKRIEDALGIESAD